MYVKGADASMMQPFGSLSTKRIASNTRSVALQHEVSQAFRAGPTPLVLVGVLNSYDRLPSGPASV